MKFVTMVILAAVGVAFFVGRPVLAQGVDGSRIYSGTVAISKLQTTGTASSGTYLNGAGAWAAIGVFGPAGTGHSSGLVPDPGSTAHTPAYYLGDDGSWHAYSSGGTSYSGTAPIVVTGSVISVQTMSSTNLGVGEPDGTTIMSSAGVLSAANQVMSGDLSGICNSGSSTLEAIRGTTVENVTPTNGQVFTYVSRGVYSGWYPESPGSAGSSFTGLLFSAAASGGLSNSTTTATQFSPTYLTGADTIAANSLTVGETISLYAFCQNGTVSGSVDAYPEIFIDSSNYNNAGQFWIASSNETVEIFATGIVTATGTSGSIFWVGKGQAMLAAPFVYETGTAISIDTTASHTVGLGMKYNTTSGSCTFTPQVYTARLN